MQQILEKIDDAIKNPSGWWFCENEYCNAKLGRIVAGNDLSPEIIELQGKDLRKFTGRFDFILTYCKCGIKNSIYRGEIGSDEWKDNFRLSLKSEFNNDNSFLDEYFKNSYRRNILLDRLSEKQKAVFQYLEETKDESWAPESVAKKCNLSKEIVNGHTEFILKEIITIEGLLRVKHWTTLKQEIDEVLTGTER